MSDPSSFTLRPGARFDLSDFDPDSTGPYRRKSESRGPIKENLQRLQALHERLYAEGARALLIVLQGMDTGGKDGTIKHVLGAFNPQGVTVTSFKVPTEQEAAHDFLWRVHAAAPRLGMVSIFNRSHYEDVLVVRVKKLQPKRVWSRRFGHINNFERLLWESGVTIVKFFLHISPEEQAKRMRERQQDPEKYWKFNPGDLDDRALWKDYQRAYEDALTKCNTRWAPWYVVPANHKWYRNLVVSDILAATMEAMELHFPDPMPDIASYTIPDA